MIKIAETIKDLRKEKGVTQKELANYVGVSQSVISNWEKAVNEPAISNLKALSEFFDVTIEYLLGITDEWGNATNIQKTPASLPADAQNILDLYNTLSPERKREAAVWLKTLNELDDQTTGLKKNRKTS